MFEAESVRKEHLMKSVSKREQDQERRAAAKASPILPKPPLRGEPTPEEKARMEAQQQAQQREYNFRRELDIRKVQALEAIAEALHVAYEEKITTWRAQQEAKAIEDQKRVEAEQAQAKAAAELLKSTEAPQAT